jgi:hypothetical protein
MVEKGGEQPFAAGAPTAVGWQKTDLTENENLQKRSRGESQF